MRNHEMQLEGSEEPRVTPERAPTRRRRRRRGMSLVEIMVAIAIIVSLMAIVGYGAMQLFGQSQEQMTELEMRQINQRIQIYTLRHGNPPSSGDGLAVVYEGIEPPKDAWGNDFIYVTPGPDGHEYDIVSLGSDGRDGTDADIRWSQIQ